MVGSEKPPRGPSRVRGVREGGTQAGDTGPSSYRGHLFILPVFTGPLYAQPRPWGYSGLVLKHLLTLAALPPWGHSLELTGSIWWSTRVTSSQMEA